MADPWHHAVSASRAWGGQPEDYLEIEKWFDESKALMSDFRHRALRHHSEGIELATRIFGQVITVHLDETRIKFIPVRWIGERHVKEDLGMIPSAVDWLREIRPKGWMNRPQRLSKDLEQPGDPDPQVRRRRPLEGLTEAPEGMLITPTGTPSD